MAAAQSFNETNSRSICKTISWRFVAVLNSFTVLTIAFTANPLLNAIAMNVSGFFVFYLFERIWNRIDWGRESAMGMETSTGAATTGALQVVGVAHADNTRAPSEVKK